MLLKDRRLAVIGAGRIGESLIGGLLDSGAVAADSLVATELYPERLEYLASKHKIRTTPDNREAVSHADVVILSVKPQNVREVLHEIRSSLTPRHLLISVAAAISTAVIEKELEGPVPVVRAMPNTPCLLKCGMTAVCGGRHATPDQLTIARRIFEAIGRCVVLDERHMDAVTGLSASGPAFIYIVIESLSEAGVKVGLPRHVATELAAQTVLGSARMVLETKEHPAELRDQVTTPAGCTIDGILELEDGGLRVTLIKAVLKATQRAAELAG